MFRVNPLLGMKNQTLFSSKDKNKKLKCRLLQFLFGTLRVNRSSGRTLMLMFTSASTSQWNVLVEIY